MNCDFRFKKKYKLIMLGLIGLFFLYLVVFYKPGKQVAEPEINLYLHLEQRVVNIALEDYIKGAVAAEMPASFEIEALKAQAVAARSYTLFRLQNNRKYQLGSDMTDDVNNCQAYVSRETFTTRHGIYEELWEKIVRAVDETRGEIMVYRGEPIDALYHSTCGGRTESAVEAWGKDIPYLQSVECEYCLASNHYQETLVFSNADLLKALGESERIKIMAKTSSGRAREIKINNHYVSGDEFRSLLNLPSNWLDIKSSSTGITINSRGYGHGIGLCQYGANGMAKAGLNYHSILSKYYQGIDFLKINY